MFPPMFLVIFASLNKASHLSTRGGIPYSDFVVPGILAYGVIATTYVNMAIGTTILRDEGILKRMQSTPLPPWAYVAARVGSTVLIVVAMSVLTLALGTVAFTTLGIGVTRFIPNAEPHRCSWTCRCCG